MSKVTLENVASGVAATSVINANNDAIEDFSDDCLSRSGASPNAMESQLDMNSNRIINLPAPVAANDAARYSDVQAAVVDGNVPDQTGNSGKFLSTDGSVTSWQDAPTMSLDATLDALADVVVAANEVIYATGVDAFSTTPLTAAARTVLDDATTGDMRTTLGLAIGTNVQAYDAELAALAGLTSAADKVPYFTGSGTADVTTVTSFARTLLDDTTAAAARTTLGIVASSVTGGGGSVHTSATPSNITGLSAAVTGGTRYWVKVVGNYECDVAGVGLKLSATFPAVNEAGLAVQIFGHAADGTDSAWEGIISSSGDEVTATGLVGVDTTLPFLIEGIIYPSGSGTLNIQAGVETVVGTPTVTMLNCLINVTAFS